MQKSLFSLDSLGLTQNPDFDSLGRARSVSDQDQRGWEGGGEGGRGSVRGDEARADEVILELMLPPDDLLLSYCFTTTTLLLLIIYY